MIGSGLRLVAVTATAITLAATAANAQFYPSTTNALANTFLNGELNRVTINSGTPRPQRYPRSTTPQATNDLPVTSRVEAAALEALRPALQRRWAAEGERGAKAWYVATARELGREMGALLPEYRRQIGVRGQVAADAWYIDAARRAGQRQ